MPSCSSPVRPSPSWSPTSPSCGWVRRWCRSTPPSPWPRGTASPGSPAPASSSTIRRCATCSLRAAGRARSRPGRRRAAARRRRRPRVHVRHHRRPEGRAHHPRQPARLGPRRDGRVALGRRRRPRARAAAVPPARARRAAHDADRRHHRPDRLPVRPRPAPRDRRHRPVRGAGDLGAPRGPPRIGALRSLRLAVSGSAPLSAALSDRVAAAIGQVPLERYGLTESGLDVSNPYDGPRVAGTVGFPLPGIELRLGEQDEIQLRGPQVISGYLDGAAPEAFLPDGWFRTGDLGRLDDEGRPDDRRPAQGADHHRRLQRGPPRGRGGARGAARRGRGRRRRAAQRARGARR